MISKTGLYVIRALSALAKVPEDSWMGTAILAQEIDAPVNYLGKLLHILAREKLILSQKGVRGGVKLARPANEIFLYEALEPFENFARWNDCLLGQQNCPNQLCGLDATWAPIRDRVLQFLRETTAAELVVHSEDFCRKRADSSGQD
jgi:Rrf2 family transcriptional regulator, iron-sulfur cluster assembly transcription factor